MTNRDSLVVVPSGESQQLFAVDETGLRPVATLSDWPPEKTAVMSQLGFLACSDRKGDTLVACVSDDLSVDDEFTIETSQHIRIDVIEFANDLLFAGGIEIIQKSDRKLNYNEHKPWLAWCDVGRDLHWHGVDLQPPVSQFRNKGIDALARSGSRIVAYDNIIEPLFALVIDIPGSRMAPSHSSTFGLPIHNTYERINGSAHNDEFIATLSSGINHGVSGEYVSVYDHSDLEHEICVFAQHSGLQLVPEVGSRWGQVALSSSNVLVAAGEAGLGVGDIAYEDGIAYVTRFGRVDRVATVDTKEDFVLLSASAAGTWNTQIVRIPDEELRRNQRSILREAIPDIEESMNDDFDLRFGLAKTDILAKSPGYRAKYGTAKIAEIAAGNLTFPILKRNAAQEEVSAHRASVSIGLIRARIDSDESFLDNPYVSVDEIDGSTLHRALEYVQEELIGA